MVKLNYLEPFIFYRSKTVMMMPEANDNRKKGALYTILAPDVDSGLKYISTSKNVYFRNLYKYFVEKTATFKIKNVSKSTFYTNKENEITDILDKYRKKTGNLKNIEGVTSYLPTNKSDVLKNFNVLFEMNHLIDKVIHNPKDNRVTYMVVKDMMDAIKHELEIASGKTELKLGDYTEKWCLIPLDLWIPLDEIGITKTFSKASRNLMGNMIHQLSVDPKLFKIFSDFKIALAYENNFMIIDLDALPEKSKETFITDSIKNFLKKSKSVSKSKEDDEPDIIDKVEGDEDSDKSIESFEKAAVKTEAELNVDKVLEKAKIDPDTINTEKREQLSSIIEKDAVKVKDAKDVDIIIQAKMAGQSIENYKRNQMLKEKYKTLSFGDVNIEDIIEDERRYEIPTTNVKANVINENLKTIKSYEFEKAYNTNLMQSDIVNILLHFGKAKPPLYLNKDIQIEDVSDTMNKLYKYTVEYEDENRKRHRFSFLLPKFVQDRYMFLNEQKWNIIHQKFPYPVTKTAPDLCQVATNYNKIRISRYGTNVSSKITKLKKLLSSEPPKELLVNKGNAQIINKNYLTSIEYDELGYEFLKLQTKNVTVYFSVEDAEINIGGDLPKAIIDISPDCCPIGLRRDANKKIVERYYISGYTNKIYDHTGKDLGELADFIINMISEVSPNFQDEFHNLSGGTKFVYNRADVLNCNIPMILFLAAADPGRLVGVLEKAKINYEFTTKRPTVDKDNKGVIPFSDGWLVFDRYPYENSLLLNGLSTVPTKMYSYYDMNNRDTYIEIFDALYNRRNLIDGIENFYYLLIDPITADVLRKIGEPDTFTGLLLYANGLLADNTYKSDANYNQTRLRSNEIVCAYLYDNLARAYAKYKDGRSEKFSIPEDCVIKDLLTSNIVDSHSKLNVTLEVENDRQVKLKGPHGMNEERSFTIEKRAYNSSMVGIIGMNSTPSGEVGINRHMTLNCNIRDARGFVDLKGIDCDGTEMLTPGELLQTFGAESADIERVAMSLSQSKHKVPVAEESGSIVNYDMERVIPYISNDFSYVAKDDGKVMEISNEVMIVKYKDGTVDDIDLSEHPDKNTDGGFYIMSQMSTDMKVGQTFKKDDIIAYDPKYISGRDEFGDHVAYIGTLARVAIESTGNVFEDATYVSDKFAHKMATRITQEKNIILSRFANIKHIVKKGQSIVANDPLITFDDTNDEFTSQLLAGMAEEAEDEENIVATTAPIVSKVTGVIKDIKIYYTVPVSDMTPSLQKIIKSYNAEVAKRENTIKKYKDIRDANTILTPSEQTTPDSTGRVKGIKVGDGILIEFYIEYEDVMGVGDKLTNYTALKGVTNYVIPEGYEAYTEFNPDRKIDAFLSTIGVYKRMCLDIIKVGGLSKILIEKKRLLRDKYLDRLEKEIKK